MQASDSFAATDPILYISSPPQILTGIGYSVGLVRDHNEDALFSLTSNLAVGDQQLAYGIFIIADGMGGHERGELASSLAVRTTAHHIASSIHENILDFDPDGQKESVQEIMRAAVGAAQHTVLQNAIGGGTTLTVVVIIGDRVNIAHVGDSRVYFIYPDERMDVVTKDHTFVNQLIRIGQITEEEARQHPERNVLYRAIGQMEELEPDIGTYQYPQDGYILICSDGLWGVVPEQKIVEIVRSTTNLTVACGKMITVANENGGPDNISVILCKISSV
ncbi:MAG: protein phosphatase 2C domain-containing protein [Anaerolineaceae bacterium]|nr:protein phosphatase 2C domain-containing protein [Anaerolineaceae bacterium]